MRTWLEKEKSHIQPSRVWIHRYLLIDQPSYSLLQNITNRVKILDTNEQAPFIEPDIWHFLLLSNHLLKLHLLAPNLGHFLAPIGQRERFHFVKIPIHLNAQVAILQVMLSSNYAFSKDLGKTTETILTVCGPSSIIYLFTMFKVHFCQNNSSFLLLWAMRVCLTWNLPSLIAYCSQRNDEISLLPRHLHKKLNILGTSITLPQKNLISCGMQLKYVMRLRYHNPHPLHWLRPSFWLIYALSWNWRCLKFMVNEVSYMISFK